ncbi:MAG: hypothetical protein IJV76_06480 [Clostridia bacterium]|nr:hypothetical protein [Clostridia bacterium]
MNLMTYLTVFLPVYLSSFFANFEFHPMSFVENLKYMGPGMICIFIVIAAIVAVVVLLEKITTRVKKSDDDSAE